MVNEGENKDMLGNHSLTLDDDGIKDASENMESKISWNGVEKYIETNNHFFIYISSVAAYIVPKRVFVSQEQKNEFSIIINENIREHIKN